MPDVNVTVRLVFGSAEQQIQSAKVAEPRRGELPEQEIATSPYCLPASTAPSEPILVQSATFVKLA